MTLEELKDYNNALVQLTVNEVPHLATLWATAPDGAIRLKDLSPTDVDDPRINVEWVPVSPHILVTKDLASHMTPQDERNIFSLINLKSDEG